MSSVYEKLSAIDLGKNIETKGKLKYLSWAWAWDTLKKNYPLSTYKVYENTSGMNYHNDGLTAWVKVGVTVEDIEHIEYLPIMDFRNNSIPMSSISSMDVNKAIQRALTKAIARHGLGLYIYAGEDLPEAPAPEPIELISQEQVLELVKLIADAETTMKALLKNLNWGINKLEEIQVPSFEVVKKVLEDRIKRLKDAK